MSLHTIQHEILAIEEIIEKIESKYFRILRVQRGESLGEDSVDVWMTIEFRSGLYTFAMIDDVSYDNFVYIEEFGSLRKGLKRFEDAIRVWMSQHE